MLKDLSIVKTLKAQLIYMSGGKIFSLFLFATIAFAGYFNFAIPAHFLFSDSVMAQEISLKKLNLEKDIAAVIAATGHRYSEQFLKRIDDGATVFSFVYSTSADDPIYARIAPDQVKVGKVETRNGQLLFELQLPPLSLSTLEIIQQPIRFCSVPISAHSSTDGQQDLIYCTSGATDTIQPLTKKHWFMSTESIPDADFALVFAQLKTLMPMARALERNNAGHFARELKNFPVMLMYSASLISTTGTLGIEPASTHARAAVALESITGILLLCWFLAQRLTKPRRQY